MLFAWEAKTEARATKNAITSEMEAIAHRIKTALSCLLMADLPSVFAWPLVSLAGIANSPTGFVWTLMCVSTAQLMGTGVGKSAVRMLATIAPPENGAFPCKETMDSRRVELVFPAVPRMRERAAPLEWIVLTAFYASIRLGAECVCGNAIRKIPLVLLRARPALL